MEFNSNNINESNNNNISIMSNRDSFSFNKLLYWKNTVNKNERNDKEYSVIKEDIMLTNTNYIEDAELNSFNNNLNSPLSPMSEPPQRILDIDKQEYISLKEELYNDNNKENNFNNTKSIQTEIITETEENLKNLINNNNNRKIPIPHLLSPNAISISFKNINIDNESNNNNKNISNNFPKLNLSIKDFKDLKELNNNNINPKDIKEIKDKNNINKENNFSKCDDITFSTFKNIHESMVSIIKIKIKIKEKYLNKYLNKYSNE